MKYCIVNGLSDRPFYPEIYYDGEYHPICGIDFNDEAATTACRDIDRFTEVLHEKQIIAQTLRNSTHKNDGECL